MSCFSYQEISVLHHIPSFIFFASSVCLKYPQFCRNLHWFCAQTPWFRRYPLSTGVNIVGLDTTVSRMATESQVWQRKTVLSSLQTNAQRVKNIQKKNLGKKSDIFWTSKVKERLNWSIGNRLPAVFTLQYEVRPEKGKSERVLVILQARCLYQVWTNCKNKLIVIILSLCCNWDLLCHYSEVPHCMCCWFQLLSWIG